ncbi:MAG: VCBS repeat-containing protein [Bauldia sp.]|nr:MAG: VCBS repeat-containing protein [Bauldia sp.]
MDAADFNGDGKSDILGRNAADGRVGLWEMNGHAVAWAGTIATVGSDWQIAETADYNGDGRDDILIRNDNGNVGLWEMDGHAIAWAGTIGNVGTDWHIMT